MRSSGVGDGIDGVPTEAQALETIILHDKADDGIHADITFRGC